IIKSEQLYSALDSHTKKYTSEKYFPECIEICAWHAHGGLTACGGKPHCLGLYGNFPRRWKTPKINPQV
ncbi:MAG TPA: hypothetical protein VEP90_04875, partial [Methylomirabilota bacterium]|nr:hypothetical protein [Methylomirabilota bacterium]